MSRRIRKHQHKTFTVPAKKVVGTGMWLGKNRGVGETVTLPIEDQGGWPMKIGDNRNVDVSTHSTHWTAMAFALETAA